jgi:hypothetical protein
MTDDDGWTRTRWWQVLDDHGELYMDTSDPSEVLDAMTDNPHFTLSKGWRREEFEWRPEDLDTVRKKVQDAGRRGSTNNPRSDT